MNTRDVSHLFKGTPKTIVALSIVMIVWRMTLSKAMCSGLVSLLSGTKKYLYWPRCLYKGGVFVLSFHLRKPEDMTSSDM